MTTSNETPTGPLSLEEKLARASLIKAGNPSQGGENVLTAKILKEKRPDYSGYRLGPYVIEKQIAKGGMGIIFKAGKTEAGRIHASVHNLADTVALKILSPHAPPDERDCFLGEVRTLINLSHPNIVGIFDCGVENDLAYYAMEWIQGSDAMTLVLKGDMTTSLALDIGRDVADALACVHDAGLIHRDLKPENIVLDTSGEIPRPVLLDFGLIQLSRNGKKVIAGTPAYMAPEQAKPGDIYGSVGPLTDVYGLGAVLYYLVTGKAPFTGENARDVLKNVFEKRPARPTSLNPDLPQALEELIGTCLEKLPIDRYESAHHLREALSTISLRKPRGIIGKRLKGGLKKLWRKNDPGSS